MASLCCKSGHPIHQGTKRELTERPDEARRKTVAPRPVVQPEPEMEPAETSRADELAAELAAAEAECERLNGMLKHEKRRSWNDQLNDVKGVQRLLTQATETRDFLRWLVTGVQNEAS